MVGYLLDAIVLSELRPPEAQPDILGLLAATAGVHEWTLVTRNVRDFPKELDSLNPFEPPA